MLTHLRDDQDSRHHELETRASTDSLTGLVNRGVLRDVLGRAVRDDGTHGYLLVLDVDRFKQVNDTYGHPTGDLLLQQIAVVLREHTRPQDVCCRLVATNWPSSCPAASLTTPCAAPSRSWRWSAR